MTSRRNTTALVALLSGLAFLAGCTAPLTTPTSTPQLVTFEDGSRSDGYCPAGALCDATAPR